MTFLTAVFWTIDIGINFITPYDREGELIVSPSAIAKRYIRTWLAFDLVLVVINWTGILLGYLGRDVGSTVASLRFLKVGQLLRALNFLRTAKFVGIINVFLEEISGQIGKVLARLIMPFICFLYLCHWIACIWFYIGQEAPTDTGMRWPDDDFQANLKEEDDQWYQYLYGINLAVSVVCLVRSLPWVNSAECVFSFGVLLTGLVAGSAFVSSLSATMVEHQVDSRDKRMKTTEMQRFLQENSVSWGLAARVHCQLEDRLATRERLRDSDVEGVQVLSESLRVELRFEICSPCLKRHPLFHFWFSISNLLMKRFCVEHTLFLNLRKDDELFLSGADSDRAFLCTSGALLYVQEPGSSPVDAAMARDVSGDCWLAEASLWSHWIHVGTALATRNSQVFAVRTVEMSKVLAASATIVMVTQEYCKAFYRRLHAAKPPATDWPNDLHVPFTRWADLVSAMDQECQVAIGMCALRQGASGAWLRSQKLHDEVSRGKSVVMTGEDGRIQRVVSVVALSISNSEGKLLVCLAKEDVSGLMKSECRLPGIKQERGELSSETMHRVFAEKLSPLVGHTECTCMEQKVEWQASQVYGVLTKYLRHICYCRLYSESRLDAFRIRLEHADDGSSVQQMVRPPVKRHGIASYRRQGFSPGDPQAVASILQSMNVFRILDSKGSAAYFAWLDEGALELLRQPAAELLLTDWLSGAAMEASDESSPRTPGRQEGSAK